MNTVRNEQEALDFVRWSNLPRLEEFLREGGDVNAVYHKGQTLLITAVKTGKQPVAQYLIHAGANLSQRDFSDLTPLMVAAERSDVTMTRLLLNSGADVNAQNKRGRTALMYAVFEDAVGVVEALVNAGADVNITDRGNQTALNYCNLKRVGENTLNLSGYIRAYQCKKILKKRGGVYAHAPTKKFGSGLQKEYTNALTLDEFAELKKSPDGSYDITSSWYMLLGMLFIAQAFFGAVILLLLPWIAWNLSIIFPSVWKIVPLWREIRDRRSGTRANSNAPSQPVRLPETVSSDIEFVSRLMELGSRELSSIHRIHAESRSVPILMAHFKSRQRSVWLAASIFLIVLILLLPGISFFDVDLFVYLTTPFVILKIVSLALLPLWIPLAFRLEYRLRLERLRLVQRERDRIAGELSTMLNADDYTDKELPAEFGLYLRAFMTTDKLRLKGFDLETMLAYSIAPALPLVALGKPGEQLGAGRIQTTNEHWKEEILRLMQSARLILIIPSHRAGTLWEIATLRNGGFFDKTIFIMPPELNFHGGKFSDDWHKTVLAAGKVGVKFPEHLPTGAFFRLNADGGFADYSPFVSEEFLKEFEPRENVYHFADRYDRDADGVEGVDLSILGANGVIFGSDIGGSAGSHGGRDADGGWDGGGGDGDR